MGETKSGPAWWYGPSGEGQIFASESDVPKGWVDHPDKLPPAPEKLGGGDDLEALRAENEHLQEEVASLRFNADGPDGAESLRRVVQQLGEENEKLRDEIRELRSENSVLRAAAPPNSTSVPPEAPSARRPRKLSAAPVTAQDETITLDEGRTERLKVLREVGITIEDDATDGDIEEALDWLAKQPKPD